MKRKILQSLVLMIVIGIIGSTILYFNSLYKIELKRERRNLIEISNNFKSSALVTDSQDNLENLFLKLNNSNEYHYYYLSNSGEEIYADDNMLDDFKLDDYIISEILKGKKSINFYKRDISQEFLIESMLLDNGNYFVISKIANNPFEYFKDALPGILALFAIGILISMYISERTVDNFVGAIEEQAREASSGVLEVSTRYKELYPFIRIIKDQSEDINKHILQMEEQGETLEAIISNMKEGMILLDDQMSILAINESAIKLGGIDYAGVNFNGVNLRGLFRSDELNEILNTVMKEPTKSNSFDISLGNKIVNVLVSPVLNGISNIGFVIFLVDETKQKLVEAQRKEFSANVSHELKTPLTSINGYAEMIMNGFVKPEDVKKFSEIIYNEGQNLLHMIDDIIKISKLDEEDQALELENVNINELIGEIILTLNHKIEDMNIEIKLDLIENKSYLFNRQILKELLLNLIDNGIKYNKVGGKLFITQRELHNKTLQMIIRDTGIGISEEDKDRIFERFFTVDKSHNKKDSSGLGLAIVKHITKLLGGTISLQSELGQGSEFCVNLPISQDK